MHTMNELQRNPNYAAIIANDRPLCAADPVQQTLNELEQSGRDLRNVTLDEFKSLLARTISQASANLVGC